MNNKMQKYRVIFFGTPKIAAKCLETLHTLPIEICAVVTKPDRPVGRAKEIIFSETKKFSLEHNIKVLQPELVSQIENEITELKPDLILTCAYGKIITPAAFSFPKFGCINIHASLLPKYRGGAPIHHAIINGEKETGITLMYTVDRLDAGDILYQEAIPIAETETYQTLYGKLTGLAQQIIRSQINNIFNGKLIPQKQNEQLVSIARNISRENEKINWDKSATEIDRLIRGLYDSPIAFTVYNGINIKILQAKKVDFTDSDKRVGEIIHLSQQGILVKSKENAVLLEIIQLPSKRAMPVAEILNGNHIFKLGEVFE